MQFIKNLFNKQYRVLEVATANNLTTFHPEEQKNFFNKEFEND